VFKNKKAEDNTELSVGTIIGIVLAVMALIAIFSLISGLFNIFTDKEKEQGAENGFFQMTAYVESLTAGNKPVPVSVMLTENHAIVGFNPDQKQAIGFCGEPSINHRSFAASKLNFAITRDPIKCPLSDSCLCLCKAQKIDSLFRGAFDDKFSYVDCYTGTICRAYSPAKGKEVPIFKNTENCEFTMIFDTKVTNIDLSKDTNGNVELKKSVVT
jgi:hypothetical protein